MLFGTKEKGIFNYLSRNIFVPYCCINRNSYSNEVYKPENAVERNSTIYNEYFTNQKE